MKEAVKEELSRAACQLRPRTPAASGCQGDGPLCRPASAVALCCEMWRLSIGLQQRIDKDRLLKKVGNEFHYQFVVSRDYYATQ